MRRISLAVAVSAVALAACSDRSVAARSGAALYKGRWGDASTIASDSWTKVWATPNVIGGNPSGTPNLLLYVGIDSWI